MLELLNVHVAICISCCDDFFSHITVRPGPVGSLAARSQHTSVLLSWNPPLIGGIIYKVQYQEPGEMNYTTFNVTGTSIELTGLKPQTTYNISVTAYTVSGAGRSTTVEIMTIPISEC